MKERLLDSEQEIEEQEQYRFNLKNINIEVKRGSKVAVIGKIGSGKSSLL